MSNETIKWLNTNVLVGNTDQRGKAWHYRASDQDGESNHYPGAIPVSDVRRRLFGWQAVPRRVAVEFPATFETMTHLNEQDEPVRWVVQDDRQAIAPSDEETVLGMFKDGYKLHQYDQWLVDNVATILDDDLGISSAGLLKNRALAWVEVSVPDTIQTPEGVEFRPNLLAATSFDGSLSSTYKRTVQLTVCDNTFAAAMSEQGQTVKIRHSSNSLNKVGEVREALALVYSTADQFSHEVARLVGTPVSDIQFKQVLSVLVPIDSSDSKRGQTIASEKRGELSRLYRYDPRVEPWTGTAFGVLQAFNTWRHHVQGGLSKSADKASARADRNALRAVTGETQKADAKVALVLADVLK